MDAGVAMIASRLYNVLSKTVFSGTKIPLQKWFAGIALIMNAKKSLSSHQLGRDLDMRSRTAWYMQTRIRVEMASQESSTLLHAITFSAFSFDRPLRSHARKELETSDL